MTFCIAFHQQLLNYISYNNDFDTIVFLSSSRID